MSIKVCEWCKNHIYEGQNCYTSCGYNFCTESCRNEWKQANPNRVALYNQRTAGCLKYFFIVIGVLFVFGLIRMLSNDTRTSSSNSYHYSESTSISSVNSQEDSSSAQKSEGKINTEIKAVNQNNEKQFHIPLDKSYIFLGVCCVIASLGIIVGLGFLLYWIHERFF